MIAVTRIQIGLFWLPQEYKIIFTRYKGERERERKRGIERGWKRVKRERQNEEWLGTELKF